MSDSDHLATDRGADRPLRPESGDPPEGVRKLPSSRTLARAVLVALLVLAPLMAGWVALDLIDVRRALTDARSSLREVAGALGEVDIDEARLALADAETSLERATSRTTSLRWSAASLVPVVGHSIDVTRDVTDTADAAVEVAALALADGGDLIGRGMEIAVVDGQIDLTPLHAASDLVERLPIERLESAHTRLSEPPAGWVPDILSDARTQTLEQADSMVDTVTRVRALTTALPGFLGDDGPRRYFVGMQTSAELRGTGGLIGYWGVLAIDDGLVTFGQTDVHDPQDEADVPDGDARTGRIGRLSGPYDVGVATDPAYEERYAYLLGASSFSNVNLDPDLPTTARVALDLYALRTGERLDGMILFDPLGLQALLEATDSALPVTDDTSATLGLDGELPVDEFAQLVTANIYDTLGFGRDEQRSKVLREIGDAAFLQLFDGAWDGLAMARAIAQASSQRHLQVFSESDVEQAAFADAGVSGSLEPPDDADLFAVSANNAVGGKQDVHLGHEFDVDVRLDALGRTDEGRYVAPRTVTLGVGVDNPLPASGRDEYVIGNCFVVGEDNRCFEGPPGWNWTWFNAWLPANSRVGDIRTDDESMDPVGPRGYRGFRVVDHFQATPPESRAGFEVELEGTAPLQRTGDGYVYEWRWWRQSKATPDLLDVRVHPPDHWAIAEIEVSGGGDGRGAGVHGEGVTLTGDVEDGVARLHGTVDAHTSIRVHLTPAG